MQFLANWASETWATASAAGPWLIGGFLAAGVLYVLLPQDRVVAHLGQPGWRGVVKASLIGIPLPLCSCSVIPVASSFRKRGASKGAVASFLVSTPETGVDSIALSYALMGPFFAVARPVVALFTALAAGLAIDRIGSKKRDSASASQGVAGAADADVKTGESAASSCGCCCHSPASASQADDKQTKRTFMSRVGAALRYGLVDMFTDLSHWLILGFLLAGLVSALFPAGFLQQHVGSGLPAILLMTIIGLPLYVCATSSTPVAAALLAQGLSPGAALAFLMVGPATNIATMLVVGRDLGRFSLAIYLTCIGLFAIAFGLITDSLPAWLIATNATDAAMEHEHHSTVGPIAAILLTLLMLNGLYNHLMKRKLRKATTA